MSLLGWKWVLSYGVASCSFFCVFLSLFFSLRLKMIAPMREERESRYSFSEKFSLGLKVSFSIFRVLSYGFLILALIVLLEQRVFEIYAYFAGILTALGCVVLYLLKR